MITEIHVPDYEGKGIRLEWEDNFILMVKIDNIKNVVAIGGNKEGLVSLARHLLTLAQPDVPINHHIHFDDLNSLEKGSGELIIAKL